MQKAEKDNGFLSSYNNNNNKEMLSLLDSLDLTGQRKRERAKKKESIWIFIIF